MSSKNGLSLADPDEAIAHNLQTHEMPRLMQRRVAGLDTLQNEMEALEQAHERRLRELERAFHEDSQGVLERRRAIVTGEDEPSDEEVAASSIAPIDADASDPTDTGCPPGIPGFWMTAMMQCDALHDPDRPVFNDNDWLVLQHVEDVRAEPWTPPAPAFDDGLFDEDGNPAFPDDDGNDDDGNKPDDADEAASATGEATSDVLPSSSQGDALAKKQTTISYEKYMQIANQIIKHLHQLEVASELPNTEDEELDEAAEKQRQEAEAQQRKSKVVAWYLDSVEQQLESMDELAEEKKVVGLVLHRMIDVDRVLLEVSQYAEMVEDDAQDDDKVLIVHPNYEAETAIGDFASQ